jgi:hypothetical protein
MKFIITESKLNLFKNKFLNHYLENGVRKFDSFILIHNNDEDDYDYAEPHFEYDFFDGRLFINNNVIQKFMDFFGTSIEETNDYISKWFEYNFGVNVKFTV